MSTKQKLIDHLADLLQARKAAYAAGEWDRVDALGMCIDDTRAELAKLAC
jgi:hypothetical protein